MSEIWHVDVVEGSEHAERSLEPSINGEFMENDMSQETESWMLSRTLVGSSLGRRCSFVFVSESFYVKSAA